MEKKIIIVSNRLPFKLEKRLNKYEIRESSGGLVSALKSLLENYKHKYNITWVGCADFSLSTWEQNQILFDKLDYTVRPIFLQDKKMEKLYYNGFSNSTIWPLFHYFPSFTEFNEEQYIAYKQVNKIFSDEITKFCKPNDTIWIHDYHLMLLPNFLKAQTKCSEIGFFLHIPFPSYEIFRLLPESWRMELLKSLLKADLIGFQTKEYANHFLTTIFYILGIENKKGVIYYEDHLSLISDYPISIDYKKFNSAYNNPFVKRQREILKEKYSKIQLIFSVDRLDYTKGVLNRLYALEKLLEENINYKENIIFILNIIPSRDEHIKYSERKKMIEENIGRINGKFGNMNWQPIIYQYRHLNFNQLLTFYTSCNIALVTPLRDGMNLVAKEFIASRFDEKGVLILSEMAGAANELDAAVIVNPTDIVKLTESLITALNMPVEEQSRRIKVMRDTIELNNVNNWLQKYMEDLNSTKQSNSDLQENMLSFEAKNAIIENYKRSKKRLILLDYDGTLVNFALSPDQAIPSESLRNLIKKMGEEEKNRVCIISGRKPGDLEKWFGNCSVTLVAEHGCIYKMQQKEEWLLMDKIDISWKVHALEILKKQELLYPNSFIEEKIYSLVWHYRNVEYEIEEKAFIEINKKLAAINSNNSFEVLHGNMVLEVKSSNINKGTASLKLLSMSDFDFVMAIGDDRTDENMFDVLNEKEHITIKVGLGKTKAKYSLIGVNNVVSFLDQVNFNN